MFLDSILNASNSYGSSSAYGYSMNDAIAQGFSKVYGSQASQEDIQRAQEANILNEAFLEAQQTFNSAEAAKNREFQKQMSSTAYQRAVEDLRKAGLNPILAAMNAGASTPSGGAASSGLQSAAKATTYANSESNNYSESHGKSENWSSSQQQSETQLKELLSGLGSVLSGAMTAFGAALSGKDVVQKEVNYATQNKKDYQDFNGNNTSAKGTFKATKPSDIRSKGKPSFRAETLA